MKIQQHDDVVVDAGRHSSRASPYTARERGVAGEEGGTQGCNVAALPPPLYIGPLGGGAPAKSHLGWGRRPRGCLAPQGKWGAPHPRVSNPRRRGWAKGGAPAHYGLVPLPISAHGPTRWTPGTLPVVPVQYR